MTSVLAISYDDVGKLSNGVLAASDISLGCIVHVVLDELGMPTRMSLKPLPGGTAHNVVGHAPWSVTLASEAQTDLQLVERLVKALEGRVSAESIRRALERAAGRVPLAKIHTTEAQGGESAGVLRRALDRLLLVEKLGSRGANAALWPHHVGLREYLLLTCFDLLGQPDTHVSLSSWLESKKSARITAERNRVLATHFDDHLAAATALSAEYSRLYGVRTSFSRFIDELLPALDRRRFLDSLSVTVTALGCTSRHDVNQSSDDQKREFLFEVRNDFTHRAQARTFLADHPSDPDDLHMPGDWRHMGTRIEKKKCVDWAVRDWPDVLHATVVAGLVAYVEQLAAG